MKNPIKRVRNMLAADQLTADGGSAWKDRHGRWRKKRLAKFSLAGGTFTLCLFLMLASIGLPFPGKVSAARAEATEIYARDGSTLLYKIRGDRNRTVIPFEQMPKCIKDATVAVEDKDFYKHQGLDPRGFGRAFIADIKTGSTAQGGSTITQQLVKNALLSNEQTVIRKARELILSLQIEQMYSKDDILRIYLNEIPYGNSAYGIQAASQTYFNKSAQDLTLAECATLASIPRGPTYYSPYNNPDPSRLINRSKYVLDQMVKERYITEADAAAAKAQIDQGLEYTAARGEDIKAPHFVFYVREQLEAAGYTQTDLQEKGYKVVTTLDPAKQDIAEDVIKTAAARRFSSYGASNAALTSMDAKTGEVLAMVGSVNYFDTANDGNVNVATAERQPGSSFKPIVYTAGFKKGYEPNLKLAFNPATLLWDVKTDFGGGYTPNNYDRKFRGPVSARDALQQSLNVPAVKMLDLVGIAPTLDLAHQMGITTLNDPDRYGDSLVLGGGEVKLVDMVTAYSVMANQGKAAAEYQGKATPKAVLKMTDRKGKDIRNRLTDPTSGGQVIDQAIAYQISDVLKDDKARAPQFGSGGPLTLPGREAAAKTGTTDSFRDAWTLGYVAPPSDKKQAQLVTGVWLGNNDNTPMNQVGGSTGAAPIWNDYMVRALDNVPATKFERPSGIKELRVDRLTGLLPSSKTNATKTDVFTDSNAPRDKAPGSTGNNCDTNVNTSELRSERPNNPNWEQPVQAFIKSNKIKIENTDQTKVEDNECGPDVSIISPADGADVSGTITIQARAVGKSSTVKTVTFTWDGEVIGSDDQAPFTTTYLVRSTSGRHTIAAKAIDEDGNSRTASISVSVGSSTPAPSVSLSLSCSAGSCTATASDTLSNVVLVNADAPAQTSGMSPSSGTSFSGTPGPGWTRTYAQGRDSNGTIVRSSTRTVAAGPLQLALDPDVFRPTFLAYLQ